MSASRSFTLSIGVICAVSGAVLHGQTRLPAATGGARSSTFALTVESIMRGPALVGYPPSDLRWSGEGARLYFEWRARDEDEAATWVVNADGSALRRLSEDERLAAPPAQGRWDPARRRLVAAVRGDISLFDTVSGLRIPITRTTGVESQPRWARAHTHVSFVRDGGLFLVPLSGAGVQQIADTGPKKSDPKKTPSQTYLADEEATLLEHVRESKRRRERDEARREREAVPKLELEARQTVSDMQLDGFGRHVWALVIERPESARSADVPDYVTETGYTGDLPGRPKVGDEQPRHLLAVLDLETRTTTWVDLPTTENAHTRRGDVRWSMPQLSDDGRVAVASVRGADNKDRWLVRVDPASGTTTVLDHLHDDAWVREEGEPGTESFGWLAGSHRLWFLSERSGWMHLYSLDVDAPGPPRALTSGSWEVSEVAFSPDRRTAYLTTSEAHPGERHLYAMSVEGGPRTRLTAMAGANLAEVSPEGRTIAIVHSTGNRPPEVYLQPYGAATPATPVTTSPTPEWFTYRWINPPVVTFASRDGKTLHARLYTPEMVGAKRHASRPGVLFVHGAGYLQNAHRYWSTYYREYMFHHLLAARGYVVLDVDYRASAGYGRDWRTAIYRRMGGKDLEDIVDGARHLVSGHKVDARRLGVYGGSYGGFITLMAMFTTPDVFAAGAALRPVTDWAHYNQPYTANILNVPQSDADAYRRSSPIYFAGGLEGALLICHGLVDVNVHAQDSIRLSQKLIELRKENWELALYPAEDHAFEEAASWTDEYKRVFKLFESNLKGR